MAFRDFIDSAQARVSAGMKSLRGLPVGAANAGGYASAGGLAGAVGQLLGGTLPGASFPYKAEAGDLWENSAVMACHKWQARQFPAAPAVIERPDAEGKYAAIPNHPATALLDTPNEWYDGTLLWASTLLSLMVDGNAYWYRLRSEASKLAGFQYIPHFQCAPWWESDNPVPILGYAYRVNGKTLKLPIGDIIHFRSTTLDPHNPRLGLSDLGAIYREVCTDNGAATLAAALLRNMGIAGFIVSPKSTAGAVEELTPAQQKAYARLFRSKTRGDSAGEPMVFGQPLDINRIAFTPSEIDLRAIRSIPEERITACTGIPAVVVGLGTGLAAAGDRNLEAMERWAWNHNILPTQRLLSAQLSRDLAAEGLLRPGERVGFDLSGVAVLQKDDTARSAAATEAVGGPWQTPNEARAAFGMKPIAGGDALYPPPQKTPPPPKAAN